MDKPKDLLWHEWWIYQNLFDVDKSELLFKDELIIILTSLENKGYIRVLEDKFINLKSDKNPGKEVIDYLNEICNKKFRYTDANLKFINGRLNEGYSINDCKKVIDVMNKEWANDYKMRDFLRPETLFNATKFQTYINKVDRNINNVINRM